MLKDNRRYDLSVQRLSTGTPGHQTAQFQLPGSRMQMMQMIEKELYHLLGNLTKSKDEWRESIPYVVSLFENPSPKMIVKALCLLGEMGLLSNSQLK